MTDPVEISEDHAGGADPEHAAPEDPCADRNAPQAWPREAGLPEDGTDPADDKRTVDPNRP
ncbi:hypothetical protein [Micromonospora robiginosa]|uniref:Uncharacterized protein n=1 Tax=Micromonospora robiginosa TaxID=2749844 RepID=A0A7L6BCM6_9ACTN|nr:hypothetical protein [Micromonospora ferruginea]QLQ39702.1 hypothetical protein H1D33_13240 [Micromonospora ferruginea]